MPDWTAGEDRYMAEYRGEATYDAPSQEPEETPEDIAQAVVSAAFAEAWDTRLDETHAELDFTLRGERILVRHIAAAIAARRAQAA